MSWLLAGHLCFAVVSPLIWLVICWGLLVDSLKHFKGSSCFLQQETLLSLNACTCWSKEQIECSANLVRSVPGVFGVSLGLSATNYFLPTFTLMVTFSHCHAYHRIYVEKTDFKMLTYPDSILIIRQLEIWKS